MDVAGPKPPTSPSANINSVIFIGLCIYLRSPISPFSICVAASASPSKLSTNFNARKSSFTFSFISTTGDCELMEMMTNRLVNSNVKALPRACPARSVRKHNP